MRRRVVPVVRQAGGVDEPRRGHAERLGLGVHHVGEAVLVAADVFGHGNARVVAGLDDDAAQQVFELHRRALAHEHLGAAGAPRLDADRHVVRQVDAPGGDFAGGDVAGHDLRQARRRQRQVAVPLGDHLAGVGIHQHEAARRNGRRVGQDLGGAEGVGGGQASGQQDQVEGQTEVGRTGRVAGAHGYSSTVTGACSWKASSAVKRSVCRAVCNGPIRTVNASSARIT